MSPPVSKRERLIRAAIDLYASRGIAATGLTDIAKRAKISVQLAKYHFRTSEELHFECTEIAGRSLGEYSTTELDRISGVSAREFLFAYVEITFRWAREHPEYFQLMLYMYYQLARSRDFAQLNAKVRKIGRQRIENLVYRGIEEGCWRAKPELPVSKLAVSIQGFLTGQVILAFTDVELDYDGMVALTQAAILELLRD